MQIRARPLGSFYFAKIGKESEDYEENGKYKIFCKRCDWGVF